MGYSGMVVICGYHLVVQRSPNTLQLHDFIYLINSLLRLLLNLVKLREFLFVRA